MRYILIVLLVISPILTHGQSVEQKKSARSKQLLEIADKIQKFYIFEKTADKLSKKIKSEIANKTFENLSDQEFADKLSSYLSKNGNDLHFNVLYRPHFEEKRINEKELAKKFDQINRQWNYGFEKVQRLDGNIGYIEYTGFPNANESAAQTLAATMAFVANTNALILDLRNNKGGSAAMVELFLSYFFEKKIKLSETYTRYNNRTTKSYTSSKVSGKKYLNKPIYILVNDKTISAAEALAYNLQKLIPATVIGGVTYGAANPVKVFYIEKKFHLFVPISSSKSTSTDSNWEHIGVIPDIKAKPDKSFASAHILAMENLLKSNVKLELTTSEIEAIIRILKS